MKYDEDKVDELTLALLYLVSHDREEGYGARAWKGFDGDTLNRLHEKGLISNPIGKAKSVGMTEEGFLKSKELFEKHFMNMAETLPFPGFTVAAKKRWQQIPEKTRKDILDNIWCRRCETGSAMQLKAGAVEDRCLVLRGACKRCGSDVARLIESEK